MSASSGLRMSAAAGRLLAGAGVLVACALLTILALTGRAPEQKNLGRFTPAGILELEPEEVTRIELQLGNRDFALERQANGPWTLGGKGPIDERETEHIRLGLRFLAVSKPTRALGAGEFTASDLAAFGLAEPAIRVRLLAGPRELAEVAFGARSPTSNDRYAQVVGRPEVYLLPPHVAAEWDALGHLEAATAKGQEG
jgi:hypothetical protein